MAQRQIVTFIDDLDGGEAEGTFFFYDQLGIGYQIDLSEENAAKLTAIYEPLHEFIEKARRAGRAMPTGPGRTVRALKSVSSARPPSDAKEIREWAAQNPQALKARGLDQPSDRGRITEGVRMLYRDRNKVTIPQAVTAPVEAPQEAPKPKPAPVKRTSRNTATPATPAPSTEAIAELVAVPMTNPGTKTPRTVKRGNLK